jgi:hypothetical protein
MFPAMPEDWGLCQQTRVCDFISGFGRDDIGVIGVCITGSANVIYMLRTYEGAVTYCALKDRAGFYGKSVGVALLGGGFFKPDVVSQSTSLGAYLGLFMDSIYDAGSVSVTGDVTYIPRGHRRGFDVNAQASFSGIGLTFSGATGNESSYTLGLSYTFSVEPSDGPGPLAAPLALLERLVWGSSPCLDPNCP